MIRGKFIAFEGIDGSGKTTQSRMLAERLSSKNHKIIHTFEPTNGEIGKLIRTYLGGSLDIVGHETMALLFAADRIQHADRILNHIKSGNIVLTDRYCLSSIAYQGAFTSALWVEEINKYSSKIIEPDLYVYIDLPPEKAIKRLEESRDNFEVYEKEELLEKVYRIYDEKLGKTKNVLRVDGTKVIDEIHEIIFKEVTKLLSE